MNSMIMRNIIFFLSTLFLAIVFNLNSVKAQCNISTGCASSVAFSVDPPVFDAANLSINFNNITIGNFACNDANYLSGVVFYIYQLLPDGSRIYQCSVEGPSPFNVVGSISLTFGQTSFCNNVIPLGSIIADPSNGFEACDGARYEMEGILYITNNTTFDALNSSVYSNLNTTEYAVINLGTIDVNINNEFPGNGQPLTTAIINDYNSGSDGPINLNCGQDIELYVEGLSRLSNCTPYSDVSTGIPSELINNFYYTINGGSPVVVANTASGAAGGQNTGPDPSLGGLCYAGVLYDTAPYVLSYADLPSDICDGTEIEFTIQTTDLYAGVIRQDQITVIYSGASCVGNCCANVDLNLTFDGFPGQTSWTIFDSNNMAVASGGNYSSFPANSNTTENTCLPDGCYTLVVNDALNNGMCPFQSSAIGISTFITPGTLIMPGSIVGTLSLVATPGLCGNYNIKDANGMTLASGGGAFGASQSNNFCLENGSAPRFSTYNILNEKIIKEVWPNPVKDFLNVSLDTELLTTAFDIKISDITGKEYTYNARLLNNSTIQLNTKNLPSGFYFVQLATDHGILSKKFLK